MGRDCRKNLHLLVEQTGDMRRRIATVRGTDHHWEYPVQNEEDGRKAVRCLKAEIESPLPIQRISVVCSACISKFISNYGFYWKPRNVRSQPSLTAASPSDLD
jgi:hypothetical protein